MECVLATLLCEGQTEFRMTHQEMIKGIQGKAAPCLSLFPILQSSYPLMSRSLSWMRMRLISPMALWLVLSLPAYALSPSRDMCLCAQATGTCPSL